MLKMKLTKEQKQVRRMRLAWMSTSGGEIFTDGHSRTICWIPKYPGSNTGYFGMAIKHPNDKFSRKYGEYIATGKALDALDSEIVNMDQYTLETIIGGEMVGY